MKQFETFGEYMFDLLFAPLKKGRKTVNQLRIFFKVMGREFDDLKAAIFRVRSEANVWRSRRTCPRSGKEVCISWRNRQSCKRKLRYFSKGIYTPC